MPTTTARARGRLGRCPPLLSLRRTLALAFSAVLLTAAAPSGLSLGTAQPAAALDNGLALTPPMGFNDWNAFGCNVSRAADQADRRLFVTTGMKAAGYTYVNIDDCWMTHSRDAGGQPGARPGQVPRRHQGHRRLRALQGAEARHLRGRRHRDLRRLPRQPRPRAAPTRRRSPPGAWTTSSTTTATTPAATARRRHPRYTAMRDALAATGRPIVYSLCEWGQDELWTWARRRRQLLAHHRRHQRQLLQHAVDLPQQRAAWPPYAGPGALERPGHAGGRQRRHDRHRVPHASSACGRRWPRRCIAGTDLRHGQRRPRCPS